MTIDSQGSQSIKKEEGRYVRRGPLYTPRAHCRCVERAHRDREGGIIISNVVLERIFGAAMLAIGVKTLRLGIRSTNHRKGIRRWKVTQ